MPQPGKLLERITEALEGSAPTPVDEAIEKLALPGDLPADLRRLAREPLKPAAVLVPLIAHEDRTRVLLMQRTESLRHHAGQISFPGGALEEADQGPVAAALRETEEETGMDPGDIEVIGFLDTYITITGFAVTPVVAKVPPGKPLRPDPSEVAELFEVPLRFLLDPANRREHVRDLEGLHLRYYSIPYGSRNIWGATAGMLKNLSDKI